MLVIDRILKEHPVRKSRAQKEAFRSWVLEQAQAMGYSARVEQNGKHANLVVGDPEQSSVLFTAHYDTPARMVVPNLIFPANIPMFVCVQLGMVLGLLAISVAMGIAAGLLFHQARLGYFVGLAVYWIILLLMMLGPANPSNANDNSSGVAAVLELMERLPQEQRERAAFILFDNEERGLLGSSQYAKAHPEIRKGKLLINMDCVGDGEHVLLLANKATRAHALFPALVQAMTEQTGRKFVLREMEKSIYPSDQRNFALGIGVCACQKSRRLGYYCDKLHTIRDTVCSQENLAYLADGLASFVAAIVPATKAA